MAASGDSISDSLQQLADELNEAADNWQDLADMYFDAAMYYADKGDVNAMMYWTAQWDDAETNAANYRSAGQSLGDNAKSLKGLGL